MQTPDSLRHSIVERFLRYVRFDTQASETSETYPSTPGQLVLLDALVAELQALGLHDARRDDHGYVFATVPATSNKLNVPVVGLIAHVDTSPEASGAGVKPIVHRAWQGGDIALPDDPTAVLRAADHPALAACLGHDIITASGTTLLGADNKAGVAVILGVAEYLLAHPEIPHGALRLGFTPDEEVGAGTKYFDVEAFGAQYAYTIDGETLGHLEGETFSADAMTVTFHGWNTHPGLAKGKMVNSIKVAADFLARLPRDGLSPETTAGKEGFVHPYVMDCAVEKTSVKFLIREFDAAKLATSEAFLAQLAQATVADWPGTRVETQVVESYRNMKEVLDRHPQVMEHARQAIRRAGLTLHESAIRGGTDGSRLSFMGLPTPNLFVGEHNYHSRLEWISAQDMQKSAEVIVELVQIWHEQA